MKLLALILVMGVAPIAVHAQSDIPPVEQDVVTAFQGLRALNTAATSGEIAVERAVHALLQKQDDDMRRAQAQLTQRDEQIKTLQAQIDELKKAPQPEAK